MVPQLGSTLPALTLRRFWTMLGHYHAQTWNGSELARALGVSDKTGVALPRRSPKVTASMRTAQQALALDHLYVVCHAPEQAAPWPLAQGITAVPLHALASVVP